MERIQVVTIPTLPRSVTLNEPSPPVLDPPDVIVMTPQDAEKYLEACNEYGDAGREDAYTLEEVKSRYPGLTREAACNWAIYGFTVQDWLTFETQMAQVAEYVVQLRAHLHFLNALIKERQDVIEQHSEALKKIGTVSRDRAE